jgi:hypothetical protein
MLRRWQGARDRLSFGLSEWPYIELVRAQKRHSRRLASI